MTEAVTEANQAGVLAGLRVLDLTGQTGAWAAKLLADFGADLVKVEPPDGAPTRRFAPFLAGDPDQPSLWFVYYHANARSIGLDLDDPADQARLRDLAAVADVLLEDFPPGYLADRGLEPAELAARNPRLIVASVTGLGQTGPHAGWRWTDLTVWSMAGLTYICGLPDREPLASAGQAAHFAGYYAAIGILIALAEREQSGRGQPVEVSAQEAVAAHNEMILNYPYAGQIIRRMGSEYAMVVPCHVMPCRGGDMMVATVSQGQWADLVKWLVEEDAAGDLADPRWTDPLERIAHREQIHAVLMPWAAGKEKRAFFREAQRRNLPFAIVSTTADLEHDEHLAAREALPARDWTGAGRAIRSAGPVLRLSEGGWRFRRPAPRLGEHTAEVFAEWLGTGGSGEAAGSPAVSSAAGAAAAPADEPAAAAAPADLSAPGLAGGTAERPVVAVQSTPAAGSMPAGSPPATLPLTGSPPARSAADLPLAGLKVADFTWVGAGPMGTRVLADFGATVIKIEAIVGGDIMRTIPPYADNIRGENRSGFFNVLNRNKLSLRIDLKQSAGRDLARQLAAWADLVVGNFSAGTMDRLGLGYETLRAANPGLIMAEMPGFGASGPYRDYISYALTLQGVGGITNLTGYPDAPPTGIANAYSDHVGGMTLALAVLLGLAHRRRTGLGQWIEIAQLESTLAMIGPAILDYFANGQVWQPVANRPREFPHGPAGVYQATGEDRWIAIDVDTPAAWDAFCTAIDRPDLRDDPDFATPARRFQNADRLDREVTAWTSRQDPWSATRILQQAGVAVGPVSDAADLYDRDDHLAARDFFTRVPHPDIGAGLIDRSPIRLGRTPGGIRSAAPLLGEHTELVLRELLGLDQATIDRLLIDGVV